MPAPPPNSTTPDDEGDVVASVEAALAPYRGLLPPEALEEMRALLEDVAFVHPTAVELRRRAAPRAARERSGDEPVDRASLLETPKKEKAGGDR